MATKQKKQKVQAITTTVEDAVSSAMSDLSELGDELRNWYDNMPENFQNGDKGQQVSDAADALEYLDAPDCPDCVRAASFSYLPSSKRRMSRADRRDEAVGFIESAVSEVDAWIDDQPEDTDTSDAEQYRDELQSLVDDAQQVEFPGMYG